MSSDDANPLDDFESLNIEGILDEALKLDDAEEEPDPVPPPQPKAKAAAAKPKLPEPEETAEPEDSMFSGLFEDALGARETESILDSVLTSHSPPSAAKAPAEEDPMSEIEVELLGEGLEPVEDEARPSLSELIKTRVSIPAEIRQPPTPAKPSASAKARGPIEVPVEVEIEADSFDGDIELILRVRITRKK